ncbi:hypothetical protein ABPG72_006185 [Tetrahymena utriculariae]
MSFNIRQLNLNKNPAAIKANNIYEENPNNPKRIQKNKAKTVSLLNSGTQKNKEDIELKKASKRVRDMVSFVDAQLKQNPRSKFDPNIDKDIYELRKQLEEQKLQDDSQNTRLLKIQQQERKVNEEYKQKKKNMEITLEELAHEAEEFNELQRKRNLELEEKKDTDIAKNDLKRKKEEERAEKDKKENEKRQKDITDMTTLLQDKKKKLDELQNNIEDLQIYKTFLHEVCKQSEEFMNEDDKDEPDVESIIERYDQLRKLQQKFMNDGTNTEQMIDQFNKDINRLQHQLEEEALQYTSQMNEIKKQIEDINLENQRWQSQIEGKLSENNNKLADYGQVILAIKNLYYNQFKNQPNIQQQQANEKDSTDNILKKLEWIQQRLIFYYEVKKQINTKEAEQPKSNANNPHQN